MAHYGDKLADIVYSIIHPRWRFQNPLVMSMKRNIIPVLEIEGSSPLKLR